MPAAGEALPRSRRAASWSNQRTRANVSARQKKGRAAMESSTAIKEGDVAERTGLEPATSAVTGQRSNRLSYRSTSPSAGGR
jgi:hypothetical protein